MRSLFITGIGTGVGKTLAAAVLAEALGAEYWKPVQAGYSEGTDSQWVGGVLSGPAARVHPELYKLKLAASPHLSARAQGVEISLDAIRDRHESILDSPRPNPDGWLIVEGAGGIMVPLNDEHWVIDLIGKLNAPVIIVSRNYLGSINHSLLTARICQSRKIEVLGWVFNDRYLNYESEIVRWTGIQSIASLPFTASPDRDFVRQQAEIVKPRLMSIL
jgi:dethiobiotin synthetase